jgi:thiol-disulfide isomerase/thioredoxin
MNMHSIVEITRRGFSLLQYLTFGILLASGVSATAEDYGYNPEADPNATYQQAIARAGQQEKLVLLVFGSEWCPDCRSLNTKMGLPPLSDTVQENFVVAHVDIGNWDRNMAFTGQFGEPVANGIPSIAIVAPDGTLLYVSEAGEFASARSTGLDSLDSWFRDRLAVIGRR